MQLLKQSTAVTAKIGPFLDDGDGNTPETALTISQADVRLSKNGGDFAQKTSATSCTHDEAGWYDCPLDATDTGTLGRLLLAVHESGALPVWHEFMVVPANVYDSLIGGSDYLQADAVQVEGGDATDAINAACDTAFTDYDPPTKAELDSGLAGLNDLSAAEVNAEVDTALGDYDPPTKAELDSGLAGLNDLSAAEVNAEVDTALGDYDPPTKAELDSGLAGLNDLSAAEVNAEVDTALGDYDPPTKAELDAALAAGVPLADGAITSAKMGSDMNVYQARVHMQDDDNAGYDRYTVVWYKNGQPVTSGITNAKIQVIKRSDGSDLIAETSMTEVGSSGLYKYDEGTNRVVNGETYFARVSATIDASTRVDYQQVGRDS